MTNLDKGGASKIDEFDENTLADVTISDEDLEVDDSHGKTAKKKAKKRSKSQLSEDEVKRIKRKRFIISGVVFFVVVIAILLVPYSRWAILNALGVRSTVEFSVVEHTDKIPLSNVAVWLDDTYFTSTSETGVARFENTTFGKHDVRVQKNGYSREDFEITNSVLSQSHKVEVKTIGIKVNFNVRNWLTGDPVGDAAAAFADDVAASDKTGRVGIVIPPDTDDTSQIKISAPGYITQSLVPPVNVDSKDVLLVSASKDYFISKRDGKFDIFSSNVDGTQQKKVIEASGKEDPDLLQFSMHRGNRFGVMVANREGRVANNRVVAGVYVIDFSNNSLRKIDEGSDVQLLEWGGDNIVWQMTDTTLGYNDPSFTTLTTFNPLNSKQRVVAKSNYFSVALVAQDKLFYAGADGYREDVNTPLTSNELVRDRTKTYLEGNIPADISRSDYDTLTLRDYNGNYFSLAISSGSVRNIDRRVDAPMLFSLHPGGNQVMWAEQRDGQGALLVRSTDKSDARSVVTLSGLTSSLRWVSDRLAVVRVVTTTETADYIVDVPTGKTAKIVDVSNIKQVGSIL